MEREFAWKKIAYENSKTEENEKCSPLPSATRNKQKQTQKAQKGGKFKYINTLKKISARLYIVTLKGQDIDCDQLHVFTKLLYSRFSSLY